MPRAWKLAKTVTSQAGHCRSGGPCLVFDPEQKDCSEEKRETALFNQSILTFDAPESVFLVPEGVLRRTVAAMILAGPNDRSTSAVSLPTEPRRP